MASTSRRKLFAAVALLAAAPALAACGAGFTANTTKPYAPVEGAALISDGAYGKNGIHVPQAYILGPQSGSQLAAGSSMPLYLWLVNNAENADTLTAVGVDGNTATSVRISGTVSLTPGTLVNTSQPVPQIVVDGLKRPLLGGETVTVTLKFANAGDITLNVPVVARSREYANLPTAPAPTPTPSASVSPAASPAATPEPSATQ